jgi:hypothetical protein
MSEARDTPRALKAVGYWNHEGWRFSMPVPPSFVAFTAGFPHPPRLVEALGACTPDDRVLKYLRSGNTRNKFLGMSYCRFGACVSGPGPLGSQCVTDGEWVWPEGLAHYVEVHRVPLPAEFLATMERHGWKVPRGSTAQVQAAPSRNDGTYWDPSFWVAWTAQSLTSAPPRRSGVCRSRLFSAG